MNSGKIRSGGCKSHADGHGGHRVVTAGANMHLLWAEAAAGYPWQLEVFRGGIFDLHAVHHALLRHRCGVARHGKKLGSAI